LAAALTFALSVVVARALGQAAFGVWVLSLAWAALLTALSEMGLNTLITREVARTQERANALLLGTLLIKTLWAGLLWGVLAFVPTTAEEWVTLRFWVWLLALTSTAYGSFSAVFRARQWMAVGVWLNVGGAVVQIIGTAWALNQKAVTPVLEWAVLAQAMQLLVAGGVWWFGLRPYGGCQPLSFPLLGQMVRQALPFALAGAVATLNARTGPLVLGYLHGADRVGGGGAAWRLTEAAKVLPQGVLSAAFPALASEPGARWRWRYQRGVLLLAVLSAGLLLVVAHPLVLWVYGSQFAPATDTLRWLSLALVPALLNASTEIYLYAIGAEGFVLKWRTLGWVILLLAGGALAPGWGARGVGVALGLSEVALLYPFQRRFNSSSPTPADRHGERDDNAS
jgi:O-antigen/teichoic acid export membrane protein